VAHHVGGHQVRGELDPRAGAGDRARERAHQQRLAQPGHAFDQHVAAREEGHEHLIDDGVLADQHLADLVANRARELGGAGHVGTQGGLGIGHRDLLSFSRTATSPANLPGSGELRDARRGGSLGRGGAGRQVFRLLDGIERLERGVAARGRARAGASGHGEQRRTAATPLQPATARTCSIARDARARGRERTEPTREISQSATTRARDAIHP
jgi:hypothetical protein